MLELVKAGGWIMVPLLLCSIIALAICAERLWTLNANKIAPPDLIAKVWIWLKNNQFDTKKMLELKNGSALGRILAAGLNNSSHGRDVMKESIQEEASHVVHELERYLDALGTVASIAPLLGLLGTVLGMIEVFNEIVSQGTGNAGALAGGISSALITTATGLSIAIPALIMHRYFNRKIDSIVVELEQQAIKMVDALHGERKVQVTTHAQSA